MKKHVQVALEGNIYKIAKKYLIDSDQNWQKYLNCLLIKDLKKKKLIKGK